MRLLLTHESLSLFPAFLFHLSLIVLYLRARPLSPAGLHACLASTFLALHTLAQLVGNSIYEPYVVHYRWVLALAIFPVLIHVTLFFLHVPGESPHRNVTRAVLQVGYALTLLMLGIFVYASRNFEAHFFFGYPAWDFVMGSQGPLRAGIIGTFVLISTGLGFWRVTQMNGQGKRRLRFMLFVWVASAVPPAASYYLNQQGLVARTTFLHTYVAASIIGWFVIATVFLNWWRGRPGLLVSVSNVMVIFSLLLAQAFVYVSLRNLDRDYDQIRRGEVLRAVGSARVLPAVQGLYFKESDFSPASKNTAAGSGVADIGGVRADHFTMLLRSRLAAGISRADLRKLLRSAPPESRAYVMATRSALNRAPKSDGRRVARLVDKLGVAAEEHRHRITSNLTSPGFRESLRSYLLRSGVAFRPFRYVLENALRARRDLDGLELKRHVLAHVRPVPQEGRRLFRVLGATPWPTIYFIKPPPLRHYIAYPYVDASAARVREVGYPYEHYRRYVHSASWPLAVAMLLMTLLVQLLYPLFLQEILVRPLKTLVKSIDLLKEGRLETRLENSSDEFGFYARSFNALVERVQEIHNRAELYSAIVEDLRERAESEVETLARFVATRESVSHNVGSGQVLIYRSGIMQAIMEDVRRLSGRNKPVLITGETGTGKELIAHLIHESGPRSEQPFVTVNCAAIPRDLLEDEVFGHVRGAFTDARDDRSGKIVEAAGGILFLDEIGEMHLDLQAKLLRVLESGDYTPLGAARQERARCRFLFATNRSLEEEVERSRFRQDLFYRINVFQIALPPLRERKEDLPGLIQHFLARYAAEPDTREIRLSPGALHALTTYPWPGNIRELENMLLRLVVGANKDELDTRDLPLALTLSGGGESPIDRFGFAEGKQSSEHSPRREIGEPGPGRATVHKAGSIPASTPFLDGSDFARREHKEIKAAIRRALEDSRGNRSQAARLLGIKRGKLLYWMKHLKIE